MATVVRDDGERGLALRFDDLAPEIAQHLEQIVASLPPVECLQDGETRRDGDGGQRDPRAEPRARPALARGRALGKSAALSSRGTHGPIQEQAEARPHARDVRFKRRKDRKKAERAAASERR